VKNEILKSTITLCFLIFSSSASKILNAEELCGDLKSAQVFDDPHYKVGSASAHAAITADLFGGEIIELRPFSENNNQQALFRVKIRARDPYSGQIRYRDAMFKPRVWGDAGGFARAPMEYVAYSLNRMLEMDYVPPTAYRKGLNLEWGGQKFTEGAFIHFSPQFFPLVKMQGEYFPYIDEAVVSDSRVLNVILQNRDAHNRNLGSGVHWVDGRTRPVFLDFGAALREQGGLSIDHFPVFGNSKKVNRIRRQTLGALRKMSFESFRPLIQSGLISEGEAWAMDGTRYGIMSHFKGKIANARANGRPESDVVMPF
jgi:hypothetical protein